MKNILKVQEMIRAKTPNLKSLYTRMNKDASKSLSKDNLYNGLKSLGIKITPDFFKEFLSVGIPAYLKVDDDLDYETFIKLMEPRGLGSDTRSYDFLRHTFLHNDTPAFDTSKADAITR